MLFFPAVTTILDFRFNQKLENLLNHLTIFFIHVKFWVQSNLLVCLMVANATFKNSSVILWRSILLVDKQDDQEKTTDLYTSVISRFELTSVVIASDCIGSCKSNYHSITATTAPKICNF